MAAMAQSSNSRRSSSIPILLLKTKSVPADGYEEYFSSSSPSTSSSFFRPVFIPVLEHRPNTKNLEIVRSLLKERKIGGSSSNPKYGGMIFTSQRAVESFAQAVHELEETDGEGRGSDSTTSLEGLKNGDAENEDLPRLELPLYTVGPATSRALNTLVSTSKVRNLLHASPVVLGADSGNGDALAHFILRHYNSAHHREAQPTTPSPKTSKLPLLFLVGEQRRDIIPKTLMANKSLPEKELIQVDELAVYETGVMESFADDFAAQMGVFGEETVVIVVVFSPSGCEAMLRCLGYILPGERRVSDKAKRRWEDHGGTSAGEGSGGPQYVIATIGPTTRDFLKRELDFEADVCAATPSPKGIGDGVDAFLKKRGLR